MQLSVSIYKERKEKIEELVLWALSQSDEKVIENKSEIKKNFFKTIDFF